LRPLGGVSSLRTVRRGARIQMGKRIKRIFGDKRLIAPCAASAPCT
jgi:hypothetical protein